MTVETRVLSAGAVKPALVNVVQAFRRETGDEVKIDFATAPEIRKRLEERQEWDVVIAPAELLDDLAGARGIDAAGRATVGRIGIGVMVRSGAPAPAIASVAEFKETLLNAEALFYNRASTGLYLESLFERLGIADQLREKTTRYPDAAPVLERISKASDGEIGFGATTVIVESERKGLSFVGPLPAEIQNYTLYAATVMRDASAQSAARRFLRYLSSPEAKRIFAAAGIE
jgi:molybdate transport system substrate-binding protein